MKMKTLSEGGVKKEVPLTWFSYKILIQIIENIGIRIKYDKRENLWNTWFQLE